jgi:ribonuclease T2
VWPLWRSILPVNLALLWPKGCAAAARPRFLVAANCAEGIVMKKLLLVVSLVALSIAPAAAPAQEQRSDTPGQFDFYVLSLSWSPSFCAVAAERHGGSGNRADSRQCGARPYSFVVHGLWPQYDKGFPEYCQDPAPRLDHRLVGAMLDVMPAPHLIFNEWDKHGTCSGLGAQAYFDTVRKARAAVTIPADYTDPQAALTVTPGAVETAFIKANPTLPADGVAVICSGKRLSEVRLCLTKDLKFRGCPEVAKRGCRRDQLVMPPVRGNNG